jgi:hypothetical protein
MTLIAMTFLDVIGYIHCFLRHHFNFLEWYFLYKKTIVCYHFYYLTNYSGLITRLKYNNGKISSSIVLAFMLHKIKYIWVIFQNMFSISSTVLICSEITHGISQYHFCYVMAIKVMTCYSKVICQIYVNYHKQQVNRQYI